MSDLFSVEELASYLQHEVDNASAELAREMATGLIESYTRRSFTDQTEVTEVLRIVAGKVHLPRRPVATVDTVRLVDGDHRYPTTFTWDGLHTLRAGDESQILNLPEFDAPLDTVEVTYTQGYDEVPADVKAVALALAGRSYSNPRGLRSETIGAYSYTAAGGGDSVASVGLLEGERAVLNRYRTQARTVQV